VNRASGTDSANGGSDNIDVTMRPALQIRHENRVFSTSVSSKVNRAEPVAGHSARRFCGQRLTWQDKSKKMQKDVALIIKRCKYHQMRITVDIDDATLDDLSKITGETKKSPAVALAVSEYIKREKAREFGKLLREGNFDYPATNDQIEKLQG
jgi:Arc/MetJ family transcription regulator